VHGTVADALTRQVDVVTMTGNAAQVFLDDAEWLSTLTTVHAALAPGGHLVFETREPSREAWRAWNRDESVAVVETRVGPVEHWVEVTAVDGEQVSFRWTYRFLSDDTTLVSDSTIRFRPRDRIEADLVATGFQLVDVRDAPDRPGLELVFLARRT
jgi:hypothetical protein